MIRLIAAAAFLSTFAFALDARAQQQPELPAPSPKATVSQRVGLTDVSVEYSSPAAKGRKIWGDLVPMDKPWRTGANAATKITFSKDVKVGGKAVPAGSYAIVTHPTAKGWSVALNKDTTIFSGGEYDAKKDLIRVPLTSTEIPLRERMTFIFSNTTNTSTSLDLEWEKVRLSLPIETDTNAQVAANIKSAVDNAWRAHSNSARYLAENGGDLAQALKYADLSIGIQSTWFNNWIRADILKRQNNIVEARKSAQIAWDLGQKDAKSFFFKDQVEKALKEWK